MGACDRLPAAWIETVGQPGGGANSAPMGNETRLERWLDRAIGRATTPRGGAMVIATMTTSATVGCGLLMTVIDHKNFATLGLGLWWAVQTVTTVGYGDHVPTTTAGMLVSALVMLVGLAFLSVVTAAITSSFVARATEEPTRRARGGAPATEHDVRDLKQQLDRMEALLRDRDINERLDRMEALLRERS
jgi:voltage-gated potassium channel